MHDVSNITQLGMVLANIRIPLGGGESAGLILDIYTCTIPATSSIALSDEHIASQWYSPHEAAHLLRVKYPENFCDMIAAL